MPTTNRVSLLHLVGALSSALPCLYLSWTLLRVWRDPMSVDSGSWVRFGVGLMVLEFVLLHSGAFIGGLAATKADFKHKTKLLGLLLFFYSLMVWAFAVSFDSTALIWIFAAVTIGRLVTAITASAEGEAAKALMAARSGIGIILYLLAVFASVMLPVPEWGITNAILADVYPDRGGGLWEVNPERAIAAAAGYFLLLGLAELFILRPGGKQKSDSETDTQTANTSNEEQTK